MRRLVAVAILALGAVSIQAQEFPSERWYQGEIILKDNTRRTGEIKYDLDHDVVQARINGRTETYSAQQVTSFSITYIQARRRNERQKILKRFFFSFPFLNDSGYKRPRFFEVVVEGKATLLAREYITTVTANTAQRMSRIRRPNAFANAAGQPITRNVLAHRLYLATLDGEIREIRGKKKDLLYLLRDHQDEMKRFIKEERLKVDQLYDVARAIAHYNTISDQQSRAY